MMTAVMNMIFSAACGGDVAGEAAGCCDAGDAGGC